jgi:hypothetical protein
MGLGTIEIIGNPEGVVGKATLADVEKARAGVEALLDYMVKLHDDILERFPPGVLPDALLVTQRFTQKEIDELPKRAVGWREAPLHSHLAADLETTSLEWRRSRHLHSPILTELLIAWSCMVCGGYPIWYGGQNERDKILRDHPR